MSPRRLPRPTSAGTADLAEPGVAAELVANRPDVIFHLAAVVSGEAETDFEKGYRVNLDGTRLLFDAILALDDYCPRVVFASSIAVIGDDYATTPRTSYGTQKAICELLLSDYCRRGFLDGIAIRLPTICVRPGTPNKAASEFFSSIIREPLNGREAVLPVPDDARHWHASSPRAAVGFLLHAATIDSDALGDRRCLTMPGVSVTVAEQIEALRSVAGDDVVRLIRREPDEAVQGILASWPRKFDAHRAPALVRSGVELRRDHPRLRGRRARLMTGIALVTGARSGIGRASAIALAEAGFTVVLAGRRRRSTGVTPFASWRTTTLARAVRRGPRRVRRDRCGGHDPPRQLRRRRVATALPAALLRVRLWIDAALDSTDGTSGTAVSATARTTVQCGSFRPS